MSFKTRLLTVVALVLAGGVAPAMATPNARTVEINFDARVGNLPAKCGQNYSGIGTAKAGLTLQDFRLYISGVRLIDKAGKEVPVQLSPDDQWQSRTVTLLDFVDGTGACNGNSGMNTMVRGTVPKGQYRGLAFDISVPFAENHQDPTLAPSPLNVTGMTWPWRIGYKFVGIDIETSGGKPGPNAATGFSIHLGSTECGEGSPRTAPTAPCANPNRPALRFGKFDAKKNKVVLDLAALLAESDVTVNAPQSASGCMSFPGDADCNAIMDRFGLPFDGKPSGGQKWIRVE
jgi:uncharacterized repeat protein (TIGR04052 family)